MRKDRHVLLARNGDPRMRVEKLACPLHRGRMKVRGLKTTNGLALALRETSRAGDEVNAVGQRAKKTLRRRKTLLHLCEERNRTLGEHDRRKEL